MKSALTIIGLICALEVFGQPFTHSELGWNWNWNRSHVTNYPPTADNAVFLISQGDILTNYIHGYDTDSVSSVWYSIRGNPSSATLSLNTNNGQFIYTPTNNFTGNDAWSFYTFENDGPLFTNGNVSVGVMPTNGNGGLCIAVQTNVQLVVVSYNYQTNVTIQYPNGTKIIAAINSPWTGYNQTYTISGTLSGFSQTFIHLDGDPIPQYTPPVPWFTNISVPVGETICFSNVNTLCGTNAIGDLSASSITVTQGANPDVNNPGWKAFSLTNGSWVADNFSGIGYTNWVRRTFSAVTATNFALTLSHTTPVDNMYFYTNDVLALFTNTPPSNSTERYTWPLSSVTVTSIMFSFKISGMYNPNVTVSRFTVGGCQQ